MSREAPAPAVPARAQTDAKGKQTVPLPPATLTSAVQWVVLAIAGTITLYQHRLQARGEKPVLLPSQLVCMMLFFTSLGAVLVQRCPQVADIFRRRLEQPTDLEMEPAYSPAPATPLIPNSLDMTVFAKGLSVLMFYVFTSSSGAFAAPRRYDPDWFLALHLLILFISFYSLRKTTGSSAGKVLNRDQTEEWKGWMQVIFLAYHYYHAGEAVYNLVRVLIGAYVWMTGFGHFIYFRTRKNYDLVRVVRTLLRLNLLCVFTCMATGNPYMLYYICPMHTFWFLVVYLTMRVLHHKHDALPWLIPAKLIALLFAITFLFNVRWAFDLVFQPLGLVLEYKGSLYEWHFRTGLDRYAAWLGMVCGYCLPAFQQLLDSVERQPTLRQWLTVKGPVTAILLLMTYYWVVHVYVLGKFEYNSLHPFWEWIPILTWVWLRNCTKTLRSYHLHMFAWWGKVTLESYISQLHILLTANAKSVIMLFPNSRSVSFVLCSAFFVVASKLLFDVTVLTTDLLAPMNQTRQTLVRVGCCVVGCVAAHGVAVGMTLMLEPS